MLKTSELCLMTTLEVTLYACMLNISKYPIINLQLMHCTYNCDNAFSQFKVVLMNNIK